MKFTMRFSIIAFLLILTVACNQTKGLVKKTYAYTTVNMPGTIPVDENGRPRFNGPDTLNLIFIETANSEIEWNHAWKNNRSYSVKPVPVNEIPLHLGINKMTGEKVILSPEPGNKLWQLQLIPSDELSAYPKDLAEGEILIEGSYKNKKFNKRIGIQTELSRTEVM